MRLSILFLIPLLISSSCYTKFGGSEPTPLFKHSYVPGLFDHTGPLIQHRVESICREIKNNSLFRYKIFNINHQFDLLVAKDIYSRSDTIYPFLLLMKIKPGLSLGSSNIRSVSRYYASQWVMNNPERALSINWDRETMLYLSDRHYFYTRFGTDDIAGTGLIVKVDRNGDLIDTCYQYSSY
jgi:hypothetical protein